MLHLGILIWWFSEFFFNHHHKTKVTSDNIFKRAGTIVVSMTIYDYAYNLRSLMFVKLRLLLKC